MQASKETNQLQLTFFDKWHRTTQLLKRQEYMRAKQSVSHFYYKIYLPGKKNFDLNQLDSATQFELIKNILLIQNNISRFFGTVGEGYFGKILKQFKPLHERFTEEQCYALAKIDVERRGTRVLAQYQLSPEHATQLIEKARAAVQNFLLPLSEDTVINCVEHNHLETLQYHLFTRFSGALSCMTYTTKSELIELSRAAHIDTLPQLLALLNQAKTEQEQHFLEWGCFQEINFPDARPSHWTGRLFVNRQSEEVTSDTKVPFSHGGGLFYIIKFLTGKTMGYRLEKPGMGIQVSTGDHKHARDKVYSEKTTRLAQALADNATSALIRL